MGSDRSAIVITFVMVIPQEVPPQKGFRLAGSLGLCITDLPTSAWHRPSTWNL